MCVGSAIYTCTRTLTKYKDRLQFGKKPHPWKHDLGIVTLVDNITSKRQYCRKILAKGTAQYEYQGKTKALHSSNIVFSCLKRHCREQPVFLHRKRKQEEKWIVWSTKIQQYKLLQSSMCLNIKGIYKLLFKQHITNVLQEVLNIFCFNNKTKYYLNQSVLPLIHPAHTAVH